MFYILDANKNVVCIGDDVQKWGEFFTSGARRIAQDKIGDDIVVSTVFLGIDHGIPRNPDRPIVFETMVFHSDEGEECWRCATWYEALAQHIHVVELTQAQYERAVEATKRGMLKVTRGEKRKR